MSMLRAVVLLAGCMMTAGITGVCHAQQLTYVNSWVGNSGGLPQEHIPHDVNFIYTRPDGSVYAILGWDEGGHNVAVMKDGRLVAAPVQSGTGSWGRNSGQAVYADSGYIYQLKMQHGCDGGNSNLNVNGLPQYPPCTATDKPQWQVVHRYLQNGQSAPFTAGYGFDGAMIIVNSGGGDLVGITAIGGELFVADQSGADTIKVYSLATLSSTPLRSFPLPRVGFLASDKHGFLWMLQRGDSANSPALIRFSPHDGAIQPQRIDFAAQVKPWAFCVDNANGRILVTDIGVAQNIGIYANAFVNPVLTDSFGRYGGIFSGTPGEVQPLKFNGPRGVGIDSSGNIYVANAAQGGQGGASFESYTPGGALRWQLQGQIFTATADIDHATWGDVYVAEKRFGVDLTKTQPGSEWTYSAYTLNPFAYPDDPRLRTLYTTAFVRNFRGNRFMFLTDMYAGSLPLYRFNSGSDGEIAIPCGFFTSGRASSSTDKEVVWIDVDGNGRRDPGESDSIGVDNMYSMAWWPDDSGGVWKGVREQGVRYFPLQELNVHGVPRYSYASSWKWRLPEGTNGVKRIYYDVAADELYLAGFSAARPDVGDSWYCMGSTLCKYTGWLRDSVRTPTLTIDIPFKKRYADELYEAKSFCVEGEYIFVSMTLNGQILVYSRETGEKVGEILPSESTGEKSGWTDIVNAITAHRQPNGEYLIFNEENGYGKVMMYRWCPGENCNVVRTKTIPRQVASGKQQMYTVVRPDGRIVGRTESFQAARRLSRGVYVLYSSNGNEMNIVRRILSVR